MLGPLGLAAPLPHPPPPLQAHPQADRVWAAPADMAGDGVRREGMVAVDRGRERVSSAVAGLVEEGLPRDEEVQNVREEEDEAMQDVAAADSDAVVDWNRTSRGVRGWRRALLLRARAQAREKREGW